MRSKLAIVIIISILCSVGLISLCAKAATQNNAAAKTISDSISSLQVLPESINEIKSPDIKTPEWLQADIDAEQAAAESAKLVKQQAVIETPVNNSIVTYDVTTRGAITADLAEFKSIANQTLNDSRGWARLGVSFQEVATGGAFTIVLSEASQVPSFYPSICSSYWSCRVGRYIVINQDRWLGASDSWNQAGGLLINYRHMVINHEVGHWLGHEDDNSHCGGAGQPAPVMQQQSIDLLGCSFNPWPLNIEIWSSTLGIN